MLGLAPTSYPLDMGGDVGVHSWSRVVQASTISLPKGYDADQEPEKGKCPHGKSETHLLPKLDEIRDPPESPCIKIEGVESVGEIVSKIVYRCW